MVKLQPLIVTLRRRLTSRKTSTRPAHFYTWLRYTHVLCHYFEIRDLYHCFEILYSKAKHLFLLCLVLNVIVSRAAVSFSFRRLAVQLAVFYLLLSLSSVV